MMNKLFNWTFGSFFRTLGRFLFYIILGLLLSYLLKDVKIPGLFNVLDVHAIQTESWLSNIESYPTYTLAYNWTSSSNYSSLGVHTEDLASWVTSLDDTAINVKYGMFVATDNSISLGSNGVSFVNFVGQVMKENYLYSITNYYCTYASGRPSVSYASGHSTAVASLPNNAKYNISFVASVTVPSGLDFNNCYAISSIIAPSSTGGWLNQRLTGSGSGTWFLMGYDIAELGIYDAVTKSDLQNAISNSGLATANSVNQVQSSVNRVQQEVQGTQSAINSQTQQQQQNHDELMDNINDDDTSQSTSSASNFFNNFNTNNHGLTGIITAPLTAIQSLTSSSCSPLILPLPFVNQNLTLPCMRDIYSQYFGGFMQLYDIITLGIISYWVMVRIFGLVKDFKNPEHDEIEVVDL